MKTEIKLYNIEKLTSYNNNVFVSKMIELFIKTANEFTLNVTMAVHESDLPKIKQLAHYIKPSIDLLNIGSLTQIIRMIESASEFNNELLANVDFTIHELKMVTTQMKNDFT